MPKDKLVHFRYDATANSVACSKQYSIYDRDLEYTKDPDDVTCNNCERTLVFRHALEKAAK